MVSAIAIVPSPAIGTVTTELRLRPKIALRQAQGEWTGETVREPQTLFYSYTTLEQETNNF